MSSITLSLQIACTREEAARFAAVELFLAELECDPAAQPPADLDAVFGAKARDAILGLAGHPEPLGITCQFDPVAGVLTLSAIEGRPNLAALPVLLLWLYPDKLPIAYSVHVTERPELAVWTVVGMNRIEITQHADEVAARIEAPRALPGAARRLDFLPTKSLPPRGD
ncbi:MAG: hypothetical protein ACKO1H_02340 [Tabrizicola sp.]